MVAFAILRTLPGSTHASSEAAGWPDPMSALTFSAFGHRWRVRRLTNERLPSTPAAEPVVTGLYFESDTAAARFLPLPSALRAERSLADVPFDHWRELLNCADELTAST